MSPFLQHVSQLVDQYVWIDPTLVCSVYHNGRTTMFLATDDGWYVSLIAQHDTVFDDEQFANVDDLLRRTGFDSRFFTIELHEEAAVVRCVLRLPIFNEPRWDDDSVAAVNDMIRRWSVIEPLIIRAARGEDPDRVITDAQLVMAALAQR